MTDSYQIIKQGCQILANNAKEKQIIHLASYNEILHKTNQIHNLTGHKDIETSAIYNILNAVSAARIIIENYKKIAEIADIGTGAGLPGIPWAILMPDIHFYLIESKKKKADFISTLKNEIGLKNVTVINKNVFEINQKFKTLVFQAFGKIDKVLKTADFIGKSNAQTILFASAIEEIQKGLRSAGINKFQIEPFKIPFAEEVKRHLVIFNNSKM